MSKWQSMTALTVGTIAIALSSVSLSAKPAQSQPAPGQRGFWCDNSSGVPITMYQNVQGNREPWIRWVSNDFSGAGYDPATRCREVSSRLETFRSNKELKFITVGLMNGQRVVCTASQVNGRCQGLIFTLKPNQDAVKTLNNLLAWREGQAGAPSLSESKDSIPFIDVSGRLGDEGSTIAPVAAPTPASGQPRVAPAQPSTGAGSREL
ncbi:COP23 domain-containing protein [Microcoleus sp. CAWBG58]|uniref:COP23 domain-containing protein n=1 Tax=Microcoleus sp. CAWBG58 TaxID=2841651 RepID=UPI0025D5D8E3|nr:COP23 domain-containing protein [Microcoleus sp. CAWBG58]